MDSSNAHIRYFPSCGLSSTPPRKNVRPIPVLLPSQLVIIAILVCSTLVTDYEEKASLDEADGDKSKKSKKRRRKAGKKKDAANSPSKLDKPKTALSVPEEEEEVRVETL